MPSTPVLRARSVIVWQALRYTNRITQTFTLFNNCFTLPRALLLQAFQLRDHPLDHAQSTLPERRVAGIETERSEQLGMVLGAAGCEHRKVSLGKTFGGVLVDRVERIHQAVAERIGIDVKRRMD